MVMFLSKCFRQLLSVALMICIAAVCGNGLRSESALNAQETSTKVDDTSAKSQEATSEKENKPPLSLWSPEGLEDFEFTDRTGETITRKHLSGKEWVIGFMFTRCRGPCPAIVAAMKRLQDETSVNMVLFTVDPEVDTPEVLSRFSKEYVTNPKPDAHGEIPKWYWLTGPREKILSYIQRNFRVPAYGQNGSPEHSNNIMHVDETGHVLGKYLGMESAEMALLRKIIQKKAPRGKMMTNPIPPGSIRVEGAPFGMTFTRTSDEAESENPDGSASAPQGDARGLENEAESRVPAWIRSLPTLNASLNGVATILLLVGYVLVKAKRITAHKVVMLSCFAISILFLASYCTYHAFVLSKKFQGTGPVRWIYFTILISHVILAATVPILASMTIYRGLSQQWVRHRAIAKVTFPIWLYVSVTGVVIYLMLYQWPAAA